MEFEDNRPKLTHLIKNYYIDLSNDQLYSRYAIEDMGLRKIKSTKKLLSKLQLYINKAKGI